MALVVEDGTGLADAESYISEAEADIFHEKRGNTAWDKVLDKEAALRKATDYMQGKYAGKWSGYRTTLTQALDWPRTNVRLKDSSSYHLYYASDVVPIAVKRACALLALRAASGTLLADQGQKKVSVTVGPISTTYDTSSPVTTKYLEVDNMLEPYFTVSGGGITLVRI